MAHPTIPDYRAILKAYMGRVIEEDYGIALNAVVEASDEDKIVLAEIGRELGDENNEQWMWKNLFPKALVALVITLSLSLSACGPVTTDAQDAAVACRGIGIPAFHDECMSNYVNNRQANRDAQWNMIGASLMNYRPAATGPLPMVNYGNRLTMCSGASGMIQCY